MIDIDEDIDDDWLVPKPGHAIEEEEEDNVKFGQTCVDRLVSCIGEDTMLPLIGTLVINTQVLWPSHRLESMLMNQKRLQL
jgi:hypothetical protein